MQILIWFTLVLFATSVDPLADLTATPVTSTVSSQTNYIISFSLPSFEDIPAGYTIEITFPSTVTILDAANSVPSTCTVKDPFGGPDIPITTMYDPANPSTRETDADLEGQCGVTSATTITMVVPKDQVALINFELGLLQNPIAVLKSSNVGSVTVKLYNLDGTHLNTDYASLHGLYTAGALTLDTSSQTNPVVGGDSTYTFTVLPTHDIPAGGKVFFVFDSKYEVADPPTSQGAIDSAVLEDLTAGLTSTSTVSVSGLFDVELTVVADTTYLMISIGSVTNPRYIDNFEVDIYTTTSSDEQIDFGTGLIGPTDPCSITHDFLKPDPSYVLQEFSPLFRVRLNTYVPTNPAAGYFELTLPPTYSVSPASDCSISSGGTASSCSFTDNTCTCEGFTQTTSSITVSLLTIVNPPDSVTTDYFQMTTYNSEGKQSCENLVLHQFTATPNTLDSVTLTRGSDKVGAETGYTVEFTTIVEFPENAKIKVIIPHDQMNEDTGITCFPVIEGVESSVSVCSQTDPPADASTYELVLDEWCSGGLCAACCLADTTLTFVIRGVKNHVEAGVTVTSTAKLYILNPTMTGTIDQLETGLQFTPILVAETIDDAAVSRDNNVVGEEVTYTFTYTPKVPYPANTALTLNFPEKSAFMHDSGTDPTCSSSVSATVSCGTIEYYSDGSVQSIVVNGLCSTECTVAAKDIVVSNIENPSIPEAAVGDFSIQVVSADGYDIEAGQVTDDFAAYERGTVHSFELIRSTDVIQSSISIEIQFTHSTELNDGSTFTLSFPQEVLLKDGTVQVYKNSVTLLSAVVTDYGDGLSVNTIEFSDYCASDCPKGNQVILLVTGLKTPDEVKAFTGTFSVLTTSSSFEIDYGETDVSSILDPLSAGHLYNIDIHPYDPTVSVTTRYRFIFTSEHLVPAGAQVKIIFPADIPLADGTATCTSYINVDSGLTCSIASNQLTMTNGFPSSTDTSTMIGFWVESITNAAASGTSGSFTIGLYTSLGDEINSDSTASVNFLDAVEDANCSCEHCSGDSSTCYACSIPSANPMLHDYSCVESCPSTHFLVASDYTCIRCHHTCASCLGPLASECTSCAPEHFQADGSCLDSCPSGTTDSTGVCVNSSPCTVPCVTCSESVGYCLSCDSSAPVLYSEAGECVQAGSETAHFCVSGYFELSNNCEPCDLNCSECLGTSTTCTACPSIYGKDLLNMLDNTCVDACPELVSVQVGSVCEPCFDSCATCDGVASTDCLTCPSTGTKYMTVSNECVSTCPDSTYHYDNLDTSTFHCIETCDPGHYVDADTSYCIPCMDTCTTCSDGTTCDSCDLEGATPFLTSDSLCVASCDPTYYEYTLNDRKECYAVECPAGSLRYTDPLTSKLLCIEPASCPSVGYYVTADDKDCSQCLSTCLTCDNGTTCLTCDTTGAYPYMTESGDCLADCTADLYKFEFEDEMTCLQECPNDYLHYDLSDTSKVCIETCYEQHYIAAATNYCIPCHLTCNTCDGATYQDCLSCPTAYPLLTETGECVTECPSDQYQSTTASRCYLTCPVGTYHFINAELEDKKQCATTCGDGFYVERIATDAVGDNELYCYMCFETCVTCDGGTNSDCLTCDQAGTTPYFDDDDGDELGTCKTDCGSKYRYELGEVKLCVAECPAGTLHFDVSPDDKECIEDCAEGYYIDEPTQYCIACDATCATCDAGEATNCTSCVDPYPYLTEAGQCKTECPSGQYIFTDGSELKCYVVCPSGYYGLDQITSLVCVEDCPDGTYVDGTVCSNCASTCETCTAGGSSDCASCSGAYALYETECLATCPEGFKNSANVCVLTCTQDGCETCADGDVSVCIVCYSGLYLLSGVCESSCPSGYYTLTSSCEPCYSTCKTCTGGTRFDCLTCASTYTYYQGECLAECPDGLVERFEECQEPCETPCLECEDQTTTICTSCESGYPILFNDTCWKSCPSSFYREGSTCEECHTDCLQCTDGTEFSCQTCSNSTLYLTTNSTCVEQCPSGYEGDPLTMNCIEEVTEEEEEPPYYPETYIVYGLLGELALLSVLALASKLFCAGSFAVSGSLLALFSVAEFTARACLFGFLWIEEGPGSSILVSAAAALLLGRSMVSVCFWLLHFSSLLQSSLILREFCNQNKHSFRCVRVLSVFFGIHFIRVLYSGLFQLSLSTGAKPLISVSAFRLPLESLSWYQVMMINIPQALLTICIGALYDLSSNSWQVAMFELGLNIILSAYVLVMNCRSPWKIT